MSVSETLISAPCRQKCENLDAKSTNYSKALDAPPTPGCCHPAEGISTEPLGFEVRQPFVIIISTIWMVEAANLTEPRTP